MLANFSNIPTNDLTSESGFIHDRLSSFKYKLFKKFFANSNEVFWNKHALLTFEEVHLRIASAIKSKSPFAIGRLGGVEANIVQWAKQIPQGVFGFCARPWFSETLSGATNAGIRPRNRESYRLFADIAYQALEKIDMQGVWKSLFEKSYLPALSTRPLYENEIVAPSNGNHIHWMEELDYKKVVVVTPFAKTISKQIPKLAEIWRPRGWEPKIDFQIVPFPYLIDEDCKEFWWEVYERIGKNLASADYDVAILGCGGLGLPLAAIAKTAGKVGLHLGGHCQLLFGIYGKRHLEQEWFKSSFTPAWTQPDRDEVPKTAMRVEGGCYW
jgi:hypothetical protein